MSSQFPIMHIFLALVVFATGFLPCRLLPGFFVTGFPARAGKNLPTLFETAPWTSIQFKMTIHKGDLQTYQDIKSKD